MIGLGGSGFGGGNPPTNSKVLGSVGGDPQSTSKWSVRAVSGLGSIKLLGLVSFPGWLDSPRGMYTMHIGLARYLNILVVDTQSVRIYIMIIF